MAPRSPVLWPVLTDPSRTYQRLSTSVGMPGDHVPLGPTAGDDLRGTRMNGSTRSYGTAREGKASRMGTPIIWTRKCPRVDARDRLLFTVETRVPSTASSRRRLDRSDDARCAFSQTCSR